VLPTRLIYYLHEQDLGEMMISNSDIMLGSSRFRRGFWGLCFVGFVSEIAYNNPLQNSLEALDV